MAGGAGRDVFVFEQLDINDILKDFNPLEDKLDISALMTASAIVSIQSISGKTGLYIDVDGGGSAQAIMVVSLDPALLLTPLANILV